jgi:hypothetical protein
MSQYLNNFVVNNVTIASSSTTSGSIDLQGLGLVGMIMPATFTGSTVTFQMSLDDVTYYDIYNTNNTQVSATVTQGRAYLFVPGDFVGVRYLKVKSSSTEGSSRVITLITRVLA